MSEQNKNSFHSMPLPSKKELADAESYSPRWGRKIIKAIGVVVCAITVIAPIAKQADTLATGIIWQEDDLEVNYVDAVQGTPAEYKKEAYIAFPGVGQKDTKNAATEHFRATDGVIPVAYVSLSNQGFTIPELAHAVDDLIDEKDLEKINIIGVSAGTQLALQTITYIEEHPDEFIDSPGEDPLPEVGYFLANSSPYDVASAYKGPIIEPTMSLLEKTNYRSGITEKFIYSLLDGPGDINKFLDIFGKPVNVDYVIDSIQQTFNGTAPLMVQDHLVVLNESDAEKEKSAWKKVLKPTTKFLYFYPSKGKDMVIDNEKAYIQFSETLQELNVTSEYVPVDSKEHADTVQAAVAFGHWLIQLQKPASSTTYNPYPEESKTTATS